MFIIPALDLRGGQAVRYLEGEEQRETVYDNDPLDVAARFWQDGARWLHIVDMDRAFDTGTDNSGLIAELVAGARGDVQLGGGVRSLLEAKQALALGVDRVVISTEILDDTAQLDGILELGIERFAVALDCRGNRLALRISGRTLTMTPAEAVRELAGRSVKTVLFRDLGRDGRLAGADIDQARRLTGRGVDVLLAGGIANLEEIRRARDAGLAGTIIGRALYEGRFTLKQALAC